MRFGASLEMSIEEERKKWGWGVCGTEFGVTEIFNIRDMPNWHTRVGSGKG
jgi:hypothetical protein